MQGTLGVMQGLARGNQQKGSCFLGDGQVDVGEWASPEVKLEPVRNLG